MNYKPVVAGNQSNGNAGTKVCDDAGKARMETVPGKDYILLPLWHADLPFSQNSKSSPDAGFKPSGDNEKKVTEEPGKEGDDPSNKNDSVNSTGNINTAINVVSSNTSIALPNDPNVPELEDIVYSDNYEDVGFEDPDFPDRVYKVEKALYGLHQAPKAWYETLSTYLLDNGFQRGKIDKTLFIKRDKANTPMETQKPLLKDEDVCACARYQINPKMSHLHAVKRIFRDLKGQPKLGLWYPKDSPFDLVAYTDSDYARASLDRKYTTGGCQFLGCRLISWQCKKQIVVANSTTEAEYVATSSYCGQVKTVNGEHQLQALVDGKKIIITEEIVKRDLQLEGVDGVDCLPNATIFE
ncbi:putative ribonuclease H-like domain-containing protein [Tanacetum coccineum]